MCSYKEKKSEPSEMMQLDGYTVDYIEASSANLMVGMGKRKFLLILLVIIDLIVRLDQVWYISRFQYF